MLSVITVLRLLAASQVILSSLALATSDNPPRVRWLGAALGLGVVGYLAAPIVLLGDSSAPFRVLVFAAECIPLLLFAFAWTVFEDAPRWSESMAVAGCIYLLVAAWMTADRSSVAALPYAMQVAKLGFALGAIYMIWRGREEDLVEARLSLRPLFMAALAVAVIIVISVELISRWRVPVLIELVGMALILLLSFAINLAFLKRNPGFALMAPRVEQIPAQQPADPLLTELLRLMTQQRLYAEHGLRIGDLARRLNVPEHQLRRAINRQLGHRNFSQFVNGYRLEEAARRLCSEPRTPVLTLALDVGFRSMSSFNTAFRAQYDAAPTAYRAKALSVS